MGGFAGAVVVALARCCRLCIDQIADVGDQRPLHLMATGDEVAQGFGHQAGAVDILADAGPLARSDTGLDLVLEGIDQRVAGLGLEAGMDRVHAVVVDAPRQARVATLAGVAFDAGVVFELAGEVAAVPERSMTKCYAWRMAAQTFPIRDLRNRTADVLDAARHDGEALISNRGRVVARLVPVDPDGRTDLDDFLDWITEVDVVDTGWADEFADAKRLDAEAATPKPWE